MFRIFIFFLILALPLAAQNDPAILQIRVIEGEGVTYPVGSRATRGVTVQVADETGKPVEGATITFRLPDNGPTGTWTSGSRSESIRTGPDGRATVWGMQWNSVPGQFEVRITAVKGDARAGTVCALALTNAPAERRTVAAPGRGHRKIWVGLGVAAGAFVGLAAAASRGTPGAATPGVTAPQIGTPSITLGRP